MTMNIPQERAGEIRWNRNMLICTCLWCSRKFNMHLTCYDHENEIFWFSVTTMKCYEMFHVTTKKMKSFGFPSTVAKFWKLECIYLVSLSDNFPFMGPSMSIKPSYLPTTCMNLLLPPLNTQFSYKYYIKYKVIILFGDTFHTACFAPDPDPFFAPDTFLLLDWYFKQRSIPRTNDRPKLVQPFLFQQIFLLDLNEGTSKWAIISQFSFFRQLEFRVLWNAKTSKIHSA